MYTGLSGEMAERSANINAGECIGTNENGIRWLLANETIGMAAKMAGSNDSHHFTIDLD